ACADGVNHRIPDIVLYVNGLPLAVIEAKRPDGHKDMIEQAISQMQRNQRTKEIPHLFAFSQLLLAIDGHNGRYGTVGTPNKFWANWREEGIQEPEFHAIKNQALSANALNALFTERTTADRQWFDSWWCGGLVPTGQDKLLVSLCRPDRLLEMIRYYTFTDTKNGKIVARYQQVFGIKALLARITEKDAIGARKGGVIWHTTGSGKSFTMVLLSKALIFQDALKNCRVIVITDRTDLEAQLSKTFASSGAISDLDQSDAMATSGRRLAEQIGKGNERIIFSLIQKFNSATKLPECHNDSIDLIVLVDEGHRSQGGENHIRMRQALPNASFIAFTGTPLLQDDKTQNKFGPIVHAYTMQRAVEDGAVTPLLYEERRLDLDVNDRAIDSWFERITEKLNDKQKADLKRKFAKKGELYKAEGRLELIAHDISDHYSKNILKGLKGQVACDSRISAIRLKGYLDKIGLVKSALVMSSPDSREGNTSADESHKCEIQAWWDENVGKEDAGVYKQRIIDQFANDDDLHLLIVIDQLLTGFDEPKNAVLYIDKNLKQHNLIQAIARVNRL
ncbi:MAG: HsdR family type I site-specific deoxyribonuclease, partial [Tolumonas sp.]